MCVVGMSVEDVSEAFNADDLTKIFLLASISTNGALYNLIFEITELENFRFTALRTINDDYCSYSDLSNTRVSEIISVSIRRILLNVHFSLRFLKTAKPTSLLSEIKTSVAVTTWILSK